MADFGFVSTPGEVVGGVGGAGKAAVGGIITFFRSILPINAPAQLFSWNRIANIDPPDKYYFSINIISNMNNVRGWQIISRITVIPIMSDKTQCRGERTLLDHICLFRWIVKRIERVLVMFNSVPFVSDTGHLFNCPVVEPC